MANTETVPAAELDIKSTPSRKSSAWAAEHTEGKAKETKKDENAGEEKALKDIALSLEARVHKRRFGFLVMGFSDNRYACMFSSLLGVALSEVLRLLCSAKNFVFISTRMV